MRKSKFSETQIVGIMKGRGESWQCVYLTGKLTKRQAGFQE